MTKDALSCCIAKKQVQQPLLLRREVKVSATETYQRRRVHYAYHEAGHALVGHVVGRCIEEVSISCRGDGYGGYCRFNPFIEDANDHPEWREDLGNPDMVTIYYAGHGLCMHSICDHFRG